MSTKPEPKPEPDEEDILMRAQDVAHDPTTSRAKRHTATIIRDLTKKGIEQRSKLDEMEDKLVKAGVPRELFNSPRGKAAKAAKEKGKKKK